MVVMCINAAGRGAFLSDPLDGVVEILVSAKHIGSVSMKQSLRGATTYCVIVIFFFLRLKHQWPHQSF